DILLALSPLDVGQGAVVAGGLVLGIETLQGTDALLRFVGDTPAPLRRCQGGVLVKAPKRGQDLRVDMPAIGPDTVRNAAAAGLE
ncbi:LpxI family protein, partial [Acinetobacter guillouiae]|uniref:LpxI family protein n=1 Tax=Acinetobacter guillouiae TaxID=106649 RepID=UPI0026E15C28